MSEGSVMAIINTIICVFRYNGSIPREEPVEISERICGDPSVLISQQKDPSMTDSEKKAAHKSKCPVSILDSRRKNYESVDLSKRKTFIPDRKAAIKNVITPGTKAATKDFSDSQEGGSQGIIVFTLWYIFIAYSYARGTMGGDESMQSGPDVLRSVSASDVAAGLVEVAENMAKELAAEPEPEAVPEADPEPEPAADPEPAEEAPAEEPAEEE